MLYEFSKDFPSAIFFEKQGPFISLYQPTHKYSPQNKQDPIRFKNLIQQIENSLKQTYKIKDIESIMKPFYQIEKDKNFWEKTLDGLAIHANLNNCVVYKLDRPVQELAVVADSLHIKPLIRIFQSADNYQVLGLSRNEFNLFQGNRYGFGEIEMEPNTPKTIKEVLGEEYTDSYLTFGSYGGSSGSVFHGQGGKKDETDKDIEKFFRYVDKYVFENYSKPSQLPLVLISLAEHHTLFRKVSKNPFLLENGIKCSYDSLEKGQLKESVWEIIEPLYLEKTKKLVDSFGNAHANSLGSDDLVQVARAAIENRVETILIEADKIIPGKIDYNTGLIEFGDTKQLHNDILDDLAELVLKKRGEVVVLPKERMPSNTGVAAIYR